MYKALRNYFLNITFILHIIRASRDYYAQWYLLLKKCLIIIRICVLLSNDVMISQIYALCILYKVLFI